MMSKLFITTFLFTLTTLICYGYTKEMNDEAILKLEMNLSAFGVEADNIPSIKVEVDFQKKYKSMREILL